MNNVFRPHGIAFFAILPAVNPELVGRALFVLSGTMSLIGLRLFLGLVTLFHSASDKTCITSGDFSNGWSF